jgi:AAA+ superfamily predicted ATPase
MSGTSEVKSEISRIEADGELSLYGFLNAFRRLNQRLKLLLGQAHVSDGSEADAQAYSGLLISKSEVSGLLNQELGEAVFPPGENFFQEPLFNQSDNSNPQIVWLAREYNLSAFDLDLILLALATELDLRYERIFAYLQDDITCKRPCVDLALSLLCPSASARQSGRARFTAGAPLIGNDILKLLPDPAQPRSSLASQFRLDEGVVNLLLGDERLDARLASFSQLIEPAISLGDVPVSVNLKNSLQALVRQAQNGPLNIYFHGPRGAGKRQAAEALAAQANSRLLVVELDNMLALATDVAQAVKLVLRETRFRNAALYLENFDVLFNEEREVSYRQVLKALGKNRGILILAGEKPPLQRVAGSMKFYEVHFPVQDFSQRRACWEEGLRRRGATLVATELDALAVGFRLTNGEIEAAITSTIDLASLRAATEQASAETFPQAVAPQPTASDLFAGARARLSHNLASFARKIEPKYFWKDLVLPSDQLSQLREICNQYKYQHVVYGEWGFEQKLSLGKGLNVLFSGHPGTGKTMAAEVIASELHLDLYKIDLSQVVSKYIGETEKNLNRIFHEAQASSSILFFDEADALFGRRTEVKDSHDRYANIEVSYLLQKMEEYDGIAILATNLRQNMDEAFLRRLQFIIEFPFPDEEHRRLIWKVVFPEEAPVASDVDFDLLARAVRLAGGNIKSIALAAAFYAASDGRVISQQHLVRAARREFQKLGRNWNERDWKIEEKPNS